VTRAIALLRAVNVGGTGKLPMAELAKLLTKLGYTEVKTIVQSGNAVFTCAVKADAKLEASLEAALANAFGLQTTIFVRSAAEWDTIIAANPFPDMAANDPSHLVVMTCKSAPTAANVKALQAAIIGRETVHAAGKQLYLTYPDGIGDSKLSNTIIERKLAVAGTTRNWNTALKLAAAASRS
jgi:uncharacterized protein (DUF1697 family)